jgi:carboxypeptidase Taq
LDEFVKAVNIAKPSLVRTEADELTYAIHVIIRYEIEKDLFSGKIKDVKTLNKV